MRKHFLSFLYASALICICPQYSMAEYNRLSVTNIDGRCVTVTALSPNVLRIDNTLPTDTTTTNLGNNLYYGPGFFQISGNEMITSAGIIASVDKTTGGLTITAGDVKITDTGIRTVTPDGFQTVEISTGSTGSFYGTGERGHSFNLRGDTLVMFNRQNYGYTKGDARISQMNITMPLFISSDGYAIAFDDYSRASMIMTDPIIYTTECPSPVSYYFAYGDGSIPSAVESLTSLTGRQDLPPLWALGYITSKYGYRTQDETLGVIDTLKTKGYPVDGIVLDLYWYGKEEDMGRLEWDAEQWPDPSGMLDSLKSIGVNLVAISQPYVLSNGRGIDNFNFLSENKMLVLDSIGNTHPVTIWVGEGGMFDMSNPSTREWLRQRYKELTDMGITGWWGDLGEPEVHPLSGFHHNGLTAPAYHNLYGNDWSRIIYDLFKEEYPDTRLMTLMRGGTTGLQKYSVFPWSTDVSRSWGGLGPQITIMLNSGLSGLGYMSHDVGGFAIDPENPVDEELYVRWLQLGLFSPVLRTHAQQVAEPYNYPSSEHIILSLIKERYRWLPYNYSLAFENNLKGLPFVRPISFYSKHIAHDTVDDEYLWGRDVLVAPVLTQGSTKRDIVFPADGKWIDLSNTDKVYDGGTVLKDYNAPLDKIPLFVRAGAFIPMAPYSMENTGNYDTSIYEINYYPLEGCRSSYTMYEDDLSTPSHNTAHSHVEFVFDGHQTDDIIHIRISSKGEYPGMRPEKELDFNVHGVGSKPMSVIINGTTIDYTYNKENHTLSFPVKYTVGTHTECEIKL